jgi:hypothetical protein
MDTDQLEPTQLGEKRLSLGGALLLPTLFIAGLFALAFVVRQEVVVSLSILGAAAFLLVWAAVLFASAARSGRRLTLEVVLFKHHWVQVCTQVVLFSYWGWWVASIRIFWPLLLAQLLFAYGFHILLTWSRRDEYGLGFGPTPITLSINLFLVFIPELFYWQFAIVALAFLGKELIRWQRDGRSMHIFNPSAFALTTVSLVLIFSRTTDATLGVEIASTLFNPPHMYAVLFLASIPVQLLFGITTITMTAVITTYAFGLAYFAMTGTYLFFDSYMSASVFLGMLLLITDPATSPRSESGRVLFGVLYGLGTIAIFGLLRVLDTPAFYDKLLPVPILNLMVPMIDRAAASGALRALDFTPLLRGFGDAGRRAVVVGAWVVVFVSISLAGGFTDEHPGQWAPFWQEACVEGSDRACDHLAVLEQNYCEAGSGWACNELGVLLAEREDDPSEALAAIRRGCSLGFPAACENLERGAADPEGLARAGPQPIDLPIILRGSKGPIRERDPDRLYALACKRGFEGSCGSTFIDP